jgi:MmyB-like transcription regulator ligand binding domain
VTALVDELCRLSPEFEAIWRENAVRSTYGKSLKSLQHPLAGLVTLEYSAFAFADLAGGAVAALESVMRDEGLLERVEHSVARDPLGRGD